MHISPIIIIYHHSNGCLVFLTEIFDDSLRSWVRYKQHIAYFSLHDSFSKADFEHERQPIFPHYIVNVP